MKICLTIEAKKYVRRAYSSSEQHRKMMKTQNLYFYSLINIVKELFQIFNSNKKTPQPLLLNFFKALPSNSLLTSFGSVVFFLTIRKRSYANFIHLFLQSLLSTLSNSLSQYSSVKAGLALSELDINIVNAIQWILKELIFL